MNNEERKAFLMKFGIFLGTGVAFVVLMASLRLFTTASADVVAIILILSTLALYWLGRSFMIWVLESQGVKGKLAYRLPIEIGTPLVFLIYFYVAARLLVLI